MSPINGKGPKGTIVGARSASDGWLLGQISGSGCTDGPLKILTYVPYTG